MWKRLVRKEIPVHVDRKIVVHNYVLDVTVHRELSGVGVHLEPTSLNLCMNKEFSVSGGLCDVSQRINYYYYESIVVEIFVFLRLG